MRFAWLITTFFICQSWHCYGKKGKDNFKMILEKMTECHQPSPPYAKKRAVTMQYNLYKFKGSTYISGRTTVHEEVFFKNFSSGTSTVDPSGRREVKFHMERQNCRSWGGQVFMIVTGVKYTKNNCQLKKGASTFKDVDIDRIAHKFPTWHSPGSLLHHIHLVADGVTVFCYEVLTTVKTAG